MKILFDQNISYRIKNKIEHIFTSVIHVKDVDLINANDHEIFMFARKSNIDIIITIDEDFIRLLDLFSTPPKIIWLRTGNCSTEVLANLLINKFEQINYFSGNPDLSLFKLIKE